MSLIVVGTNHKISPIAIREKVSFSKKGIKEALLHLADCSGIKAGVIISTCNRVELYADTSDIETGVQSLKALLGIEPYLYTYIGKSAIEHLFEVACGLDSQIIGETQILEQVRAAWQQAKVMETTNRFLDTIFAKAIEVSPKVRQQTGICQGKVSLASIVMELIKTRYTCLKNKKVLLIGTGKICTLVVKYLKKEELKAVFIANRTYGKAKELAGCISAEVLRFGRLKEKLKDADIVISATSSPHLILKKEDLKGLNKPLLIIDLAVPRDVDPQARQIKGISIFDLDDLGVIIEQNLKARRQSIPDAAETIKKEVENLCLISRLEREPAAAPLL